MMDEIILKIFAVAIALIILAALVVMCISDTETFRAIDEKIARAIKGEDDDETD